MYIGLGIFLIVVGLIIAGVAFVVERNVPPDERGNRRP